MNINILNKKISFGFVFSALSIVVDSLAGLIILPMLLNFLSKNIVGLWIFFLSFSAFVALGQAGLGPVITKTAASLKVNNSNQINFWGNVNFVYAISAALVILICSLIYFFYIKVVLIQENYLIAGTQCWALLSISFLIKIFFSKNFHILNGYGEVGLDKLTLIVSSLINLIGFFLVLKLGFGLVALGLVHLFSSIIFAISSITLLQKLVKSSFCFLNRLDYVLIKKIGLESIKILILNLCSFIILQSNFFIIERLFGLEILPYYSGLFKLITLVMAISATISSLYFPFISQAENEKDFDLVKKLFYRNIIFANLLGVIFGLTIFSLAPLLIPIWLGEGSYLGPEVFAPMILLGFIYINTTATANTIIAIGANYFVKPSLVNASISIPIALILGKYFGIAGVIYGNIFAAIIPSTYIIIWSHSFMKKRINV